MMEMDQALTTLECHVLALAVAVEGASSVAVVCGEVY